MTAPATTSLLRTTPSIGNVISRTPCKLSASISVHNNRRAHRRSKYVLTIRAGYTPPDLSGKVCIVTGGSRGVGAGIAKGLGEAGATVYVTGRSLETPSEGFENVGGTLVGTATQITELGGKGIAVQVDQTDDDQVEALFKRVIDEQGKLDLLVNNAWGVPADIGGDIDNEPKYFWEQGVRYFDGMFPSGIRGAYLASCIAAPLLMPKDGQPGGLIININSFAAVAYSWCVAYGTAKQATERMTKDMAFELKSFGVACLQLWPGLVRTERLEYFAAQKDSDDTSGFGLSEDSPSESAMFSGRAAALLLADHDKAMAKTGQRVLVAEFAEEEGFTDVDGSQPPSTRDLRFMVPFLCAKAGQKQPPAWAIPAFKIPFQFFDAEPPEYLK